MFAMSAHKPCSLVGCDRILLSFSDKARKPTLNGLAQDYPRRDQLAVPPERLET